MNCQAVAIIPKSNAGEYTRLRFIPDCMTEEQVKTAIKNWESNSNEKVKLFTDPEIIKFAKYTRQLELSIVNQSLRMTIENLKSIRHDIQNALTDMDILIDVLDE